MKFHKAAITEHFSFIVIHSTSDGLSHAKVTKFEKEVEEAIDKSNDFLRGLLRSIENQHRDSLERVGK